MDDPLPLQGAPDRMDKTKRESGACEGANGHRSIQVAVDIYGHLVPGGNISWIDRISSTPEIEPKMEPRALAVTRESPK
jgi:hypothetical protein